MGLLGSIIFTIGIVVYGIVVSGIVALRRRVLPGYNWLPLIVGIIPLLTLAASVIAMLVSGGSDYAGTQKVAIMLGVPTLAANIAWILLGVVMWPRGDEEASRQNVSTPVEPAI